MGAMDIIDEAVTRLDSMKAGYGIATIKKSLMPTVDPTEEEFTHLGPRLPAILVSWEGRTRQSGVDDESEAPTISVSYAIKASIYWRDIDHDRCAAAWPAVEEVSNLLDRHTAILSSRTHSFQWVGDEWESYGEGWLVWGVNFLVRTTIERRDTRFEGPPLLAISNQIQKHSDNDPDNPDDGAPNIIVESTP